MKNILTVLLLLLPSSLLFSADINCEIKSTATIQNPSLEPSYYLDNAAKLEFKSKGDNYYGEISAKALYASTASSTSSSLSFQINRAYTEFYTKDFSFSVGKQRLAWGTGYVFNYADVFNPVNYLDPKGEKEGINAITQKINIGDTAKVELAQVFKDSKALDLGARTSFTVGNFEFTGDYLKTRSVMQANQFTNKELFIAEVRGEFEVGLWSSVAHIVNTFSSPMIPTSSLNLYSIGADYTIDIFGNTLYLLEETGYNDTTYNTSYYGLIRLTPSQDFSISQSALAESVSAKKIFSTVLSYTVNDFITTSLTYNRYVDTNSSFTATNPSVENDLAFVVKTNF